MRPARRRLLLAAPALLSAQLLHAQQPSRRYRIGVLLPVDTSAANHLPVIRERLATQGFAEGRNLEIDVRYARTNPDAAQELLAKKPDALLASTDDAVQAAQLATKSTPIVFAWVADPVLSGFVKTYARPGGNTTGIANRYYELTAKRVELLHELLPGARRVGMLGRLHDPVGKAALRSAQEAAKRLKIELINLADVGWDWALAIERLAASKAQAVCISANHAMIGDRFTAENMIRALAQARIPAVFAETETVELGGLMSYATSQHDELRRAADLLAKILRGDKPSDTPVEQAARFELAVNLKTARALGLKVPQSILLRADKVIE
jgi:putative tryptophan/tyrosine transport system substrate-binding protein